MPGNVHGTLLSLQYGCNEGHSHAVSYCCECVHVWFLAVINYNQSTEDQKTVRTFKADALYKVLEGECTPHYDI